jgi:hypothetical protein
MMRSKRSKMYDRPALASAELVKCTKSSNTHTRKMMPVFLRSSHLPEAIVD